ncbi:hypothetical protein SAMN05421874_101559 [Nonomuraea maritima]|uniref:Uncharacterized protein n=1 Tax=Nonomuraea maritima TaxID=683260 RepID=A0A1G8T389_9ACTN|nr:hypothetical protein [Nonomuraea maritima]SDJ36062.1 hypothetical protein SAMN05421874_101559 [Nonomuraea maritima]
MLVAAAVCPPTPLVVFRMPDLRSTARTAIAALTAARPDVLIVVGGAESTEAYDGAAAGTLSPWGVHLTAGRGEPVLPLSLTVGRLLLEDSAPDRLRSVAFDASADDCGKLGEELGATAARVALLVMADGSACLGTRAPGRYDDAAAPFNAGLGTAIAAGDPAPLAALDPALADRLWVSGRAALQVLAGAAGDRTYEGRLLAETAPYGVGYFVGTWT